jgi:hypothetical protein
MAGAITRLKPERELATIKPELRNRKRVALRKGTWAWGLMLKQPVPTLHKTTHTEIISFGLSTLTIQSA